MQPITLLLICDVATVTEQPCHGNNINELSPFKTDVKLSTC